MKVSFVFSRSKRSYLDLVASGQAPDSGLMGQNHLQGLGIDSEVYDPLITRRSGRDVRGGRAAVYLRELTLPFELGGTDVVFTTLNRAYPLVERRRKVLLMNEIVCTSIARRPRYRAVLSASVRAADGVLCFSEQNRRDVIAQTGADPARVHALPMTVDENFFVPHTNGDGGYVLTVGFDPGRDYRTFTEAIAGLPYKVVMVAKPQDLEGLTTGPNVTIEPDASYLRLRDLYAGARCVVLPIHPENFTFGADVSGATVLTEAMAMAKPMVLTYRSHWEDYVVDGESALFVPPRDPDAMRDAIRRIWEDRPLARSLGDAALARAREDMSSSRFAERLADIIGQAEPVPARFRQTALPGAVE